MGITFLDCDGVIYDSNAAKTKAFEAALAEYPPAAVAEMITWHKEHGGVSRYTKLERFFTVYHPVDDSQLYIERALERFGDVSLAGYRKLRPRPEALEFAAKRGGSDSVYVVTGAKQAEVRQAMTEHGILQSFADVLGSPGKKRDHMARVLERAEVAPRDAVMIGDGRGDFDACQDLGVPFIFLAEMSEWIEGVSVTQGAENARVAQTWADILAL